jgi:hypothetical protein
MRVDVRAHVFPAAAASDAIVQDILTGILQQRVAAFNADSTVLQSATATLALLRMNLQQLAAAAKLTKSANAILFSNDPACEKFRLDTPALHQHHKDVLLQLQRLQRTVWISSTMGVAHAVLQHVRNLIKDAQMEALDRVAQKKPPEGFYYYYYCYYFYLFLLTRAMQVHKPAAMLRMQRKQQWWYLLWSSW